MTEVSAPLGVTVFHVTEDGNDTQLMQAKLSHVVHQAQWVRNTLFSKMYIVTNTALQDINVAHMNIQ